MENKKEVLIKKLKESLTEEDILENLILIVKGFDKNFYTDIIHNNPYYKSLIPDIKSSIISDLDRVSKSIQTEIDKIELNLKSVSLSDSIELKKAKRECLALIYEIDERKKEIDSLSQ